MAPNKMQAYKNFQEFKLLEKETLVEEKPGKICPVRRFAFELPPDTHLDEFDLGLGDALKIQVPGGICKPRSYSPTNVTSKGKFEVTIKIYPDGQASQYIDSLNINDVAMISGPFPPPCKKKDRLKSQRVNIISFGIGITEGLYVAKAELEKGDAEKVVLLYANRHLEDEIFKKELSDLENQFPNTFKLVKIFSQDSEINALTGRVNEEILKSVFELDPEDDSMIVQNNFLIVGNRAMKKSVWGMLESMGFSKTTNILLRKQPKKQK